MYAVSMIGLFREFLSVLHRQSAFIWLLARREVVDRYAGSSLGIAWALLHPLCLMGVYLVVFNFVFVMRMPSDLRVGIDYVAYFIAGYLPWMYLQETMSRGCGAVTDNRNLVKQVVFPLEVLPLRTVVAAAFPQLIGTLVLCVYLTISGGFTPLIVLWPVAFALQMIFATGLAFFLASLTVFLRDTREILSVLLMMGLYFLPIIYLPEMMSGRLGWFLVFNPFSHFIWMFQDIWVFGSIQHPLSWVLSAFFALGSLLLGFWTFQRLKGFFGNYL